MNQKISLTKKIESLTLEISKIRNENHGLVEENNNMREIIEKKKI
jgi:regulator of replication initiation timing